MGCTHSAVALPQLPSEQAIVPRLFAVDEVVSVWEAPVKPCRLSSVSSKFRASTISDLTCGEAVGVNPAEAVQLVVFDLDETLTLATFMPKNGNSKQLDTAVKFSFGSPWVSERLRRLQGLLEQMAAGPRELAVLTRNEAGIDGVLRFLVAAKLDAFFSAIWVMPQGDEQSAAYRVGSTWNMFSPPFAEVPDHKADLLHHVAEHPEAWFPQIGMPHCHMERLARLRFDNIMLIDDKPENFESHFTGLTVGRFCLVHTYEANFHSLGVQTLGGLGSRNEEDYAVLTTFVAAPWACLQYPIDKEGCCSTEEGSLQDGSCSQNTDSSGFSIGVE